MLLALLRSFHFYHSTTQGLLHTIHLTKPRPIKHQPSTYFCHQHSFSHKVLINSPTCSNNLNTLYPRYSSISRCYFSIYSTCITSFLTQSEIHRRGNVENDSNSSAIIGFPIISDYFQCRKYRFPDVGPRRKCQGFCALKSSEFRLKHALRNFLSMYFH